MFMYFSSKKSSQNPSKMRSERLKNDAKNMLFSDIDFFAFLLRFWRVLGLQVGAKLAVLDSQDPPQSHQNPVFWEHVPKMLPKRLQSKPQRRPKEGPGSIFGGFSIDLGAFVRYFWLWKCILNQNSRWHGHLRRYTSFLQFWYSRILALHLGPNFKVRHGHLRRYTTFLQFWYSRMLALHFARNF